MDTLSFIGRMGIARLGKLDNAIASALAQFDPASASQVDIDRMIENSHKLAAKMAEYHGYEQRDAQIVADVQSKLKRTQMAAQIIGDKLEAAQKAGSPTADLTTQLNRLSDLITGLGGEEGDGSKSGELFEAIQNHNQSASDYAEWSHLHDDAVAKLGTAQQRLEHAKRDMDRASMQEQHARERQARAEQEAGLRASTSSDGVALSAMERAAQDARKRAETANIEADALSHVAGNDANELVERTLHEATSAPVAEDALARMRRLTGKSVRPS